MQKTKVAIYKIRDYFEFIKICFTENLFPCLKRIFNSANVLPVLGACISFPDLILVNQFMPYGSLFNLLHEQKGFDSFLIKS
jgi:integrin-linked kinase